MEAIIVFPDSLLRHSSLHPCLPACLPPCFSQMEAISVFLFTFLGIASRTSPPPPSHLPPCFSQTEAVRVLLFGSLPDSLPPSLTPACLHDHRQMESISVFLFTFLGVASMIAVYAMTTYQAGIFMGCVAAAHSVYFKIECPRALFGLPWGGPWAPTCLPCTP